ncbi:hypothetical protein OIE66_18055 [Nonomuraea sp. NBC_01738]|uniref:hypothetical protein n=1 Tax=Nonomuraea sp. NBC_01738 TaxID=2976003 RepID=UPI002E12F54A|nr:hypothetical protein OIE66_18055 [Nonomuraea sp. NBC_01738]
MRVNWKDGAAALSMGLVSGVYVMFLRGAELPVIGEVCGATAAISVLGMIGGCGMVSADLFEKPLSPIDRFFMTTAMPLAGLALAAAVFSLVTASVGALGAVFFATLALWLVATLRHAAR